MSTADCNDTLTGMTGTIPRVETQGTPGGSLGFRVLRRMIPLDWQHCLAHLYLSTYVNVWGVH